MIDITIKGILDSHRKWLHGDPDGERANFLGADLREADLQNADLTKADLRGANLQYANLSYATFHGADLQVANFKGASLSGAYLMQANLRENNLQWANLLYAHLSGADLSEANLQGACLQETDLYGTNLTRARITGTVLDPRNTLNMEYKGFKEDGDYIIGYRTKRRLNSGHYSIGEKVKAPYFSTCTTECHPGLYLYPTIEMVLNFQRGNPNSWGPIIVVRTKKTDIHKAGKKWRCKEFEVLAEYE
jgi:hypothetical protein